MSGDDDTPLTQVTPTQSWWLAPVQIAPWMPEQITGLFRPWVIILTLAVLAAIGVVAWRKTRTYA